MIGTWWEWLATLVAMGTVTGLLGSCTADAGPILPPREPAVEAAHGADQLHDGTVHGRIVARDPEAAP